MRRVFENDSGSKSGHRVPANYRRRRYVFFFPLSQTIARAHTLNNKSKLWNVQYNEIEKNNLL